MTDEPDNTPAFAPPDPSLRVGMDEHDRVVSDPGAPVIIGVSFDSQLKAQEYLIAMSRLRQEGVLQLKDAVTVTKQDDGKVAVEFTKLGGMKDHITVPVSHPFLMMDREVARQTIHFLKYGQFHEQEDAR